MQVLYNQLIYFAFFQSILLLCVFAFAPKYRRHLNPYLIILTVAMFLGLLGKVIYISEVWGRTHKLIIISEFAGMLFGTTTFLLVVAAIRKKAFEKSDLVHFLPAIVYISLCIWYFSLPDKATVDKRVASGEFYRVIYIFLSIGILVNIAYWGSAVRQLVVFENKLADEVSYQVRTRFMRNILKATGGVLLIWVGVYIFCLIDRSYLIGLPRQLIWLSWTFIMLFIAYYIIANPKALDINPLPRKVKYAQSKLSSAQLDDLKQKLDQYMEEQKPYLNAKLLKAELAEMMGLNKPDLARLLNEKIGMNFFEYVNYFRIKEFIQIAQKDEAHQYTFFALAQEAGFNSKTTFNKSFKKVMGSSPTDYFNMK